MKECVKISGAVLVIITVVGLLIQVTTISFSNPAKPCLVLCFDIEGHATFTKPATVNIKRQNPPWKSDTKHKLFWNSNPSIETNHDTENVNNGFPKLVKIWKNDIKYRREKKIQFVRDFPKVILLWNSPLYFSASFGNCSLKNCIITKDRNLFNKSKVIVFYPRHLNFSEIPRKLNNQVWVYLNMESPEYTYRSKRFTKWINAFNWTATYRRDSDILFMYGHVAKREQRIKLSVTDVINEKSKMAAWFNSHCKTSSKREIYGSLLMKTLNVDEYGKCGKLKCNKYNKYKDKSCWSLLNTTYKYYLSFENSVCKDYITEKSLHRLNEIIVLIVRGGADYSLYLPPNSYIDTKEYNGPSELSKFAKMLVRNNSEYLNYHGWRNFYKTRRPSVNTVYCEICKRLNNISKYKRVYYDIHKWWTGKGYQPFCKRGTGGT